MFTNVSGLLVGGISSLKMATAGLVVVASIALAGTGISNALFTAETTVGDNAFVAGSIDIATSPSTAAFDVPNMAPGDKVTSTITVDNTGTLEQRYALVSTSSENELAAQLEMTIKSGVASCDNAGFEASGTVIYGANDAGSTSGINVIGNPLQGADAGDRVLSASASEDLCVQLELPVSTPNSFQSSSTTLAFAFYAEQTTNN